jgi:hypothetical protein
MSGRRRLLGVAAVAATSTLIWESSSAALSDTVTSSGNGWRTGSVAITTGRQGVALFDGAQDQLRPGTETPKCIVVAYTGDVGAEVRLYLTGIHDHGRNFGDLVVLRIETGSGSSCSLPGTWTSLSDTTVRATAAASDWATGLGSGVWKRGEKRPYRITPIVADTNAAQGGRVDLTFVWEARSH